MKLRKREIEFCEKSINSFGFSWRWVHVGLLTVYFGSWTVHLFPEKKFCLKLFEYNQELCRSFLRYWGGGWLYLVCKLDK